MTSASGRYSLRTTPSVRRSLAQGLPEPVAVAAYEFMTGPLCENPYRAGKQLLPPLNDRYSARRGTYRILYRIDDKERVVTVVDIAHRRDAYRT
ncbi:type II toxin-antitoxin system RelE/ParE family toxin [Cryptosporangium minutisporangium]|uniref:Type II toxin-antitoxin system RelE/ParE family toxin n=1 Tax=Cryptosporangium minutisporangium TaxID=113569 RepID=A0ABP6TD13_9ACTN